MLDVAVMNHGGESLTMSSREIAELTGKRHDHVMRDIEEVLSQAEIDFPKFGDVVRNKQNQSVKVYNLPKRECDLVVSGYSVKYRLKIIDRWHELELNIPQLTQDQQLLQLAEGVIRLTKERDEAIKTKAQINDKRTATLMNKASQDAKKIKKLESQLQHVGEYISLLAAKLPQRIDTEFKSNVQTWRVLKQISESLGHEIIKAKDERYGEVNTYHVDVIDVFKSEYL